MILLPRKKYFGLASQGEFFGFSDSVRITFFIFLAGYFLLYERYLQYLTYYLLVLLPMILIAWRNAMLWRASRILTLSLLYIAFMTASSLWGYGSSWHCLAFNLAQAMLTASFIFIACYLGYKYPDVFKRRLKAVLIVAFLVATIYVIKSLLTHGLVSPRLSGLGQFDNPNSLGVVYGLLAVMAGSFMLSSKSMPEKLLFVTLLLLFVAVVLLTQSRNALISTGIAMTLLVLLHGRLRSMLVVFLGLGVMVYTIGAPVTERLYTDGLPWRMGIWQAALEQIQEAWLLGNGSCSLMTFPVSGHDFSHPHSVYLTTAWQGGLVGLFLLLWLYFRAYREAWHAFRTRKEALYLALLTFSMVCIAPDFSSIITRPREAWWYVWLPLAMAAAAGLRAQPASQLRDV